MVAVGGFAGIETIAAVNDFLREAIRYYPYLKGNQVRVVLVDPGLVILPEFGPKLGAYAQRKLSDRKVEFFVNTKVAGVSKEGVRLSDGTSIRADTLVCTAGASPNPIVTSLPCRRVGGRLVVGEYMEVPDWPGVWALGDCAAVQNPRSGGSLPTHGPTCYARGQNGRPESASAVDGRREPFVFTTRRSWE